MGVRANKAKQPGVSVVEAVLLTAIVVIIIGVGAFVFHQKHVADQTLAGTRNSTQNTAPPGSTASVDQLTEQAAKNEAGADSSADNAYSQAAVAPDTAINNLGGAYNESNY